MRVTLTRSELIAFCRERLAAYKCPKTVDVKDELPRNPTGKILKKDLRKPHLGGARPRDGLANPSQIRLIGTATSLRRRNGRVHGGS